MNDSDLLDLLGKVNAYSADTDLPAQIRTRAVALHEIDRRIDMVDTKERPANTTTPVRRRRNWTAAVAAFAVVLIAGVALLALTIRDEPEPDPAIPLPTTTQAVTTTVAAPDTTQSPAVDPVDLEVAIAKANTFVTGFVADVNAGASGAEIVSRHFPPVSEDCANTSCEDDAFAGGPARYPFMDEWFDHLVGLETVYELGDCRPIGTDGLVACGLRSTSPYEPFHPDSRVEEYWLQFDGDEVVFAELLIPGGTTFRFAETEFAAWLAETHPDVAATTYTAAGANGFEQRQITSNWELVVQNLIEYVPEWRSATEGS